MTKKKVAPKADPQTENKVRDLVVQLGEMIAKNSLSNSNYSIRETLE